MLVDEMEWRTFERTIAEEGYEVADFILTEAADVFTRRRSVAAGSVEITQVSTGAMRAYGAGHGSSWTDEFRDDLARGRFG